MTVSHARFLAAAAATMLSVLLTSPGSAQVARFDSDLTLDNQMVSNVRYYGHRRYGYRGYGYRRYGYRYGYGYRGAAVGAGIAGAAVGAGVAGLAAGAATGAIGAQAVPGYYYGGTQVTDADAYACRSRFSNYDPVTRLGLSNEGIWYFCPSGMGVQAATR